MAPFDHPNDPRRADVRVEFGVARAEVAQSTANRATAEQWAAMATILDEARHSPDVFVDPLLPMRAVERVEFAERAAAADLAVRLGLSEASVRNQAADADLLLRRLPGFWTRFREGEVVAVNARIAADLVRSLPHDDGLDEHFDAQLCDIVGLAPARFRARARVLREQLHSVSLAERHRVAAGTRGVWIENDLDGMADLWMRLPADVAHGAFARIDAAARDIAADPHESRTLAQVRADVAGDLLTAGQVDAAPLRQGRVAVSVTVPVMTLLGSSDEPGTLDGYGPIDADTARRLAAQAPSFTRLLTHPVTGTLIDIDRVTYRVPADLKRAVQTVHGICGFANCGRRARTCDLDHVVDHQYGGRTRLSNLIPLCRHHHRLKHMTRWTVSLAATEARTITWTSPTGYRRTADPPPF